jgi:hypothetical protein
MSQIVYDLERESLFSGEVLKGSVNLIIDKPVKARAVWLDILGLEMTKRTNSQGRADIAYIEKHHHIKEKIYLYPPEMGGEHELSPGNFKHDFELKIPETAPPSYEGEYVRITYRLETRVDVIAWRDIIEKKTFYVHFKRKDLGSLTQPADFHSQNYLHLDYKKPGFNVELETQVFKVGDSVTGTIAISNLGTSKLRKIEIRLIAHEIISAAGYRFESDVKSYELVLSPDDFMEELPKKFEIPISNRFPVSFKGKNSALQYFLEVQFDLPLQFDVKERHPVEIIR